MAQGRPTDKYANIATGSVTMSAANTITFTEVQTGASLGNSTGWLIDEIDYQLSVDSIEDLVATGDFIKCGLTTSNSVANLDWSSDTRIIHSNQISLNIVSAANTSVVEQPFCFQFFPPMIVAAPKIYLALDSGSLAAAAVGYFRIHYRYVKLTTQEYLEIAEAFTLIS